jgi:formyltetrahydrofolate deformylase
MTEYVLTLSCPDRPGIVAAVSGALAERDCNIVESQQFGDRGTGRFFMRTQFDAPGTSASTSWRSPPTTPTCGR